MFHVHNQSASPDLQHLFQTHKSQFWVSSQRETKSTPKARERLSCLPRNPHVKRLDIPHRPAQEEGGSALGQAPDLWPCPGRDSLLDCACTNQGDPEDWPGTQDPNTSQGARRMRVCGLCQTGWPRAEWTALWQCGEWSLMLP